MLGPKVALRDILALLMDGLRSKYFYNATWGPINNFVRKVSMCCFSKVFLKCSIGIILTSLGGPGLLIVQSTAAKQLALFLQFSFFLFFSVRNQSEVLIMCHIYHHCQHQCPVCLLFRVCIFPPSSLFFLFHCPHHTSL